MPLGAAPLTFDSLASCLQQIPCMSVFLVKRRIFILLKLFSCYDCVLCSLVTRVFGILELERATQASFFEIQRILSLFHHAYAISYNICRSSCALKSRIRG
jgi:hypothetical protein